MQTHYYWPAPPTRSVLGVIRLWSCKAVSSAVRFLQFISINCVVFQGRYYTWPQAKTCCLAFIIHRNK